MDITKVVEEKFKEIVDSGFIEEKIKETLKNTVAAAVDSALRSYSDFGKEMNAKVKEALALGNMELKLPTYNHLVLTWITEIVDRHIKTTAKNQIEKELGEFFVPIEKEEYKISEIIDMYKEGLSEDGKCGSITFIRDSGSNDSYVDYYFDADDGTGKYRCDYQMRCNKDGIWAMTIEETDVKGLKTPLFYGFDLFLFHLYVQRIKIVDDSDNVDEYYGDD